MKATVKMNAQSMKRGITTLATPALVLLVLALVPASLQAKVIKVPSGAIQTIQQGVDAAAPGDMVLVRHGTYVYETGTDWPGAIHIWPDKDGLRLKAAGPVKIVGPGLGGIAITIEADNVSVEGFEISGFRSGIVARWETEGSQTQVTGNTISECSGVSLELRGAANYEVAHNTVIGGSIGILLQPESAANPQHHLHHNTVTDAEWQGIMVATAPGSRLDHNVCNNNFWEGIYLAGSPNSTAEHNRTDNNGLAGIEVGGSPNCVVTGNKANNNVGFLADVNPDSGGFYAGWGILVWNSCGSRFERNAAQGNELWDLVSDDSSDSPCNTYLNNRADTASPSLDLWDVKSAK